MMIRINLLPHREMRREKRKKDFVGVTGMVVVAGIGAAMLGGFAINSQIEAQNERNRFIEAKNKELDTQIAEIRNLEAEIQSLKARQSSVERLQANRTIPVHLVDELVRQVPEGMYLKSMRQSDKRITLVGHAQTNERIAELLRNISNDSPWLDKPELIEIKAVSVKGLGRDPREDRRLYEFSLGATIKGPGDAAEQAATAPVPGRGQVAAN